MQLIGRERETKELTRLKESYQAEFVVLYGRRRVGKTFLVRSFFDDKFSFYCTGLAKGSRKQQLKNFGKQISEYTGQAFAPEDWFEAFNALKGIISRSRQRKKVVFLDEVPWMDTQKSEFKQALDLFWNGWGMMQPNLLFIVCGSAASWMVKNVINDKGGLHNRLTCKLHLLPFTLKDTKAYLYSQGCRWTEEMIANCYMILGGIPYYLHLLDKSLSLAQNVDRLFFEESALLSDEFNNLYSSLFKKANEYIKIITQLSKKKSGYTRNELTSALKQKGGGGFTRRLEELEQCGFIRKYLPISGKTHIYQLVDFFTLFYLNFGSAKGTYDQNMWLHMQTSSTYSNWLGLSFERLCFAHIRQIQQALGISGIATKTYALQTSTAQMDMVIDRADNIINLCEMKYTGGAYALSKSEAEKLQHRIQELSSKLRSKSIIPVLVTNSSAKKNAYYNQLIYNNITLKELFV